MILIFTMVVTALARPLPAAPMIACLLDDVITAL